MTATDELRKLLDERSVEWCEPVQMEGSIFTRWNSDGVSWTASMVHGRNNALRIGASTVTPEQAIAATLGRGTCEYCKDGKFDEQTWMMSNHGWQRINYCPNCGAKVVSE